MNKSIKGTKVYNIRLDEELVKRLDHLSIDCGVPRQKLIDRCIAFSLEKMGKSKKIKEKLISK